MLPYNILSINFNIIFAVTVTFIISSLNSNKIIVNSYKLNSHHNMKDDSTRTTELSSSSSSSAAALLSLPLSSVKNNENIKYQNHHKSNHHLKLNNKHNLQRRQQHQQHHQQQQSLERHHSFVENTKYNSKSIQKYPHQLVTLSSTSSVTPLQKENQQNENHHLHNKFALDLKENNESPREINFSSISKSSINKHSHQHTTTTVQPLTNSNQYLKKNLQPQNNHQQHHQQHHNPSSTINYKKPLNLTAESAASSSSSSSSASAIKSQIDLNSHKILEHHEHRHHNSNEKKSHRQIPQQRQQQQQHQHQQKTPKATTAVTEILTLDERRKNLQHNKKHNFTSMLNLINRSDSRLHHKTINANEYSSNTSTESKDYHDEVNRIIKQFNTNHHKTIDNNHYDRFNPNIDKTHHDDDGDNDDDVEEDVLNDVDDDEDDDDNDDDRQEEDDDDYYYNEDHIDNIKEDLKNKQNIDDHVETVNHIEFDIKNDQFNEKLFNINKKLVLNRENYGINKKYYKKEQEHNDHGEDHDDDQDDENDDIMGLIKNNIEADDVDSNYEKEFDLYDYIDDEPKADNETSTAKKESLTEEKWEKYGTAKAVASTRRRYYSQVQRVNAHIMRVGQEAECRIPKPKIIQISDPSKRYVPHCTVLHRCSDDTGCCQSDFRTCVMKKFQTIDLYFYVVPLGMKEPIVETLSFENHTECHCIERERYRPPPAHLIKNDTQNYLQDEQQQNSDTNLNLYSNNLPCQCAKHFTIFEEKQSSYDDSNSNSHSDINKDKKKCRCDCVSNDNACQRLKQGEEGFAVEDRRCISENRCTIPTCEFGDYSSNSGRCPKNKQKRYISSWHFD